MNQPHDTEMRDLLCLAEKLGQDPLLVQGPGGNISLKRDGIMWVKASGTWMMDAMTKPILIPVALAAVLDGLASGDPSCETCSAFVRHDLLQSPLRPSIETTLHAVMPHRVVVHVHCVETISQACLSDAPGRLEARLEGLDWAFVPYVRPGVSLGQIISERIRPETNVVVLGKHGLVAGGASVAEAEKLRAEVSRRLARPRRTEVKLDPQKLRDFEGGGYRAAEEGKLHALATDPVSLAAARCGSLYPDHVVFLGRGILETQGSETAAGAARRAGRSAAPLVIAPGVGALLHEEASASARALAGCLADVTCRLSSDDPIDPLSPDEEAQLLDWDAEKYRQSLDKRTP
jgi:rhamnose utilization protein RhaD (predicted bifunctional aldolase and dehydrogenase)